MRPVGASWSGHGRAPHVGKYHRGRATMPAAAMEMSDTVRPFGPLFLHGERDRVLRGLPHHLDHAPAAGSGSMAIVNWSTGLSRVVFLRSTRASSLAFSDCLVVGDAPLAGLLVDDELRGAVLVGDGEQRVRAGGERVAADLDRLLGREQGRLVGAGAPDLAVGDQAAPDLADLGRSRASWCRGGRRRASSRCRRWWP